MSEAMTPASVTLKRACEVYSNLFSEVSTGAVIHRVPFPLTFSGIIKLAEQQEELLWGNPSLYDDAEVAHCQKKRRDYKGYDPELWRQSTWYKKYVNRTQALKRKEEFKFRKRFRMPRAQVLELTLRARNENWFPSCERVNALGQIGIPIDLLILGALRYLGRGWTFDDLEEATGVSEEVHRLFFHKFVAACANKLFPEHVKYPRTESEIQDSMAEFTEAGFTGCIGSTDCTHVVVEKMAATLKNANLGGKLPQTARSFEITVNHRRKILATTVGYPGRWNDKTVVRFDKFVSGIHIGELYSDIEYQLYNDDGTTVAHKGLWLLVDNGYLNWSCTIPPYTEATSQREIRWSRWAESMRKDVECTFGILKGRWRVLKNGIKFPDMHTVDHIWFTCCALHNWLLDVDGLSDRWRQGVQSIYSGEMGLHEYTRQLQRMPHVFRRLAHSGDIRSHDPTGLRWHENEQLDETIIDNDAPASSIRRMSLETFRKRLVTHFDYLWRRNMIKWPSRNGVVQYDGE